MSGFDSLWGMAHELAVSFIDSAAVDVTSWFYAWLFAWAGVAKLRSPTLAAQAMRNFHLVTRGDPRFGIAAGSVELLLALALASIQFRAFAALAASVLLSGFFILIARSLARGDRFSCHCFGSTTSRISVFTALRAGVLAIAAAIVAAASMTGAAELPTSRLLEVIGGLALLCSLAVASTMPKLLFTNPLGEERT